jgi:transposase
MAATIGTGRRPRRQFTDEFKAQTARRVLEEGKSIGAVPRDLDLTASALRLWFEQTRAERTKGKSGLVREEREELTRLRKENRQLRMDREIPEAAAFFVKHRHGSSRGSLRRRPAVPSSCSLGIWVSSPVASARGRPARNRNTPATTAG